VLKLFQGQTCTYFVVLNPQYLKQQVGHCFNHLSYSQQTYYMCSIGGTLLTHIVHVERETSSLTW